MKKILCPLIPLLLLFCLFSGTAHACTGVYIGREATTDGSVIIARSNDTQGNFPQRMTVVPRIEQDQDRQMPVDNEHSSFFDLPNTTFKYIGTPFMASAQLENGTGMDDAVCINEYGVAMTMSVTAFSNKAAMAADPWIAHGITETTMNQLVLAVSRSAREAVQKLSQLIDQYGSSETNIALIIDQKEAWYVEMYTGHQYAAVKLPEDKVSVLGNEFNLEYLSDYADCITSENLEKLAV